MASVELIPCRRCDKNPTAPNSLLCPECRNACCPCGAPFRFKSDLRVCGKCGYAQRIVAKENAATA